MTPAEKNAVLEEAALKADQKLSDKGYYGLAQSVRAAIRALKEQEPST